MAGFYTNLAGPDSARFYRCLCGSSGRQSISPLALWLGDHTSPELQYLDAQFAALLSYGACARILSAVLPLENATSITTWKRHVTRVGLPVHSVQKVAI
jgi:hypothetical protein